MKARSSRRTVDAPHVERAYRDLKAGIVKGRYRPGSSLSEVSLASEHGMSRTPIREGLARLWQEGYLDRVVGHGYFVARVTVQQIHDTFDVRRSNINSHLAFGAGTHKCLGEHLARAEMRVVAQEVLRLMPDVELVPGFEPQWLPARTVRGLTTLPVQYSPFEV